MRQNIAVLAKAGTNSRSQSRAGLRQKNDDLNESGMFSIKLEMFNNEEQ